MRSCVLHRFYGLILLLETLGPVRGDRQKAEIISDELGVHNTKLRRHFCNALAYICAFDTGSDNVTAVALDAQPCCTTVLIAANRGVSPEVVEFLQDILSILHDIAQSSPGTDTSLIQEDIIHKVVRLSQPRVRRYHEVAVDMYKSCLPIIQSARIRYALANPKAAELARLEEFLTQYFNPSRSIESDHECLDLVKQCHSIRASGMIDSLTLFAAHGQPCQAKFLRLQELLKKLGKHITCSKRLVNAATQLSEEFVCDFKVEPIQPSKLEPICLPLKKASVDSIVARMTSGISEGDKVKEQLKERHPRGLADISQEIEEKLRVAKTQTHAELILISYIEQHGCDFRDPDDRYIGCSKPACYLCHLYIHYHPGKYSVPDTSNKLYVKWRMPDIRSSDQETRVKLNGEAEKILDKMIQEIKTSFKNDLTRPKPRSMHADSSADMTSTIMGGPGLGAGPGPGLQPSDIARHLESLSLATPAYYQEPPPAASDYSHHPLPQPQQPFMPLHHHPQFHFLPLHPHSQFQFHPSYQALHSNIPISSSIPQIPSTPAALFYSYAPISPFPNTMRNNNGNSNIGNTSSSGNGIMPQHNNNFTSFNNGQEQQVSNSQREKRPGWRGPPSRRWVSSHH